jgi:hypothetical protein
MVDSASGAQGALHGRAAAGQRLRARGGGTRPAASWKKYMLSYAVRGGRKGKAAGHKQRRACAEQLGAHSETLGAGAPPPCLPCLFRGVRREGVPSGQRGSCTPQGTGRTTCQSWRDASAGTRGRVGAAAAVVAGPRGGGRGGARGKGMGGHTFMEAPVKGRLGRGSGWIGKATEVGPVRSLQKRDRNSRLGERGLGMGARGDQGMGPREG